MRTVRYCPRSLVHGEREDEWNPVLHPYKLEIEMEMKLFQVDRQ